MKMMYCLIGIFLLTTCSNPNLYEVHFQSVNDRHATSLYFKNTQEELTYYFSATIADPSPIDIYRDIEEGEYDWHINCGYLIDSGMAYIDSDNNITVWDDTTYTWQEH